MISELHQWAKNMLFTSNLACDIRPPSNPTSQGRIPWGCQFSGEVVETGARSSKKKPHSNSWEGDTWRTHGIDEAISAIEAAIVRTKRLGINQPKTMPTWPPDTNGKEKVDVTEATTPMIEKEKATTSINLDAVNAWLVEQRK
jgi:hypothetical protein